MSTAADDEGVMRNFIHVLETFWALVDLAGYPLIAASTLCAIWPGAATNRNGPAQVKVPATPDLPDQMPLDVVISLYLGFANPDDLATFEQAFVVNQPHLAVGKAILPPYDGGTEELYRRTSVILSMLAEQRAFESVVDPPYPRDGYNFPAYAIAGDVERLQHSMLERDRIVNGAPDRSPMDSSSDKECCMAASDEGFLHEWRLWTILSPDKVFSITFRGRKIPNSQLGDLIEALQDLRASTFLDLSGIQLSLRQLMTVLRQFPEVEALSISGNKLIQPGHLPALIASTPTLRRLHAMHLGFESFDVLHSLLHEHSAAFRQLEGLMCPPLLTPNQEITWPASFIFHHATQATSDRPIYVSVPLCTPAQVVQALTEILRLAFQEYRYGESAALWYRNLEFLTHARPGPNSYAMPANGFPFYMSAETCLHTVLSSATLRPDQCWGERPVVGVPSHSQAYTLRGEGGRTWMFWFDWDHRRHQRENPGKNMWGFVRCEATLHGDVDDPDGITTGIPLHSTYSQTVHDLRGYLRCMADEGRPLPDADAVERLERILAMRDPDTMQPVCALMTQDDLEPIVGRPSTEEDRKFDYKDVYRGLTGENLRTGVMFPGYWPGTQSRRSKSLFL
ncbi:uncharacterized protein TRAVEDRAFT_23430 [Trametes versicolor FP-101664 SS1]|uniref:uncharacterized protein n=1 Tax=Trametes versicolor (strain FP-101664) TaxID=717944 RepID=UPI0004623D3E|nr:uncharacterized protein TRAVEDRAFT_23430 [Trametes versicolor FP-101664 SS1]EIW54327.1 hypothetical protein TRAVEDRAFT_23430 [Trametes versicolor FP-101664 SS1]